MREGRYTKNGKGCRYDMRSEIVLISGNGRQIMPGFLSTSRMIGKLCARYWVKEDEMARSELVGL